MDQWLKTGSVGKRRTTELETDPIPGTSMSSNVPEENPSKKSTQVSNRYLFQK